MSLAEDVDYKFFKALISSQGHAIDFVNSYSINPFLGDVQDIAGAALEYIKRYKQPPTKNVLKELAPNLSSKIDDVYDRCEVTDYNSTEYKFYLDKIKERHVSIKSDRLKSAIAAGASIKDIDREIKEIRQIEQPNRKAALNLSLDQYLPEFHKDYSEKIRNPEYKRGILTGYSFLDSVTNGIAAGELYIIGGETAAGKALPLDTPIPTPLGFRNMGDLHVGDNVFGVDGKVYKVLAESEIINEPGWKFTFTDNSEIISHDNHLWHTYTNLEQSRLSKSKKSGNKPPTGSTRTSKEISRK